MSSIFEERLAPLIASKMKAYKVPGVSIAVIESGKMVWSWGSGWSDKENSIAATPDTLYKIGSITKVFTATAVMQLAEKGLIGLDNPVSNYIPEFSARTRFHDDNAITIRDLMTHHSGLPCDNRNGFYSGDAFQATERFTSTLAFLKETYAAYPRGHVFSYSNAAISLLGILVERISGKSFEEYIQTNILDPLDMVRTSFQYPAGTDKMLSKGYNETKGQYEAQMRDLPAGGLTSSANDMAKFICFASGSAIRPVLGQEALSSMFEVQNAGNPRDFGFKIGLNWMLSWPSLESAARVAWHDGGSIHYLSMLAVLPGLGSGVVVLTNSARGVNLTHPVANEALAILLKSRGIISGPFHQAAVPGAAEENSISAGKYATIMGVMELCGDKGKPMLRMKGQSFRLTRQPDGWYAPTLMLFGKIPLRIKQMDNLRLSTRRTDAVNILGLMQVVGPNKFSQPLGAELVCAQIPRCWLDAVGSYRAVNDNFMLSSLKIVLHSGVLSVKTTARKMGSLSLILRPLSDTEAVIQGLGRFAGETVELLTENGAPRLKISGLIFIREK